MSDGREWLTEFISVTVNSHSLERNILGSGECYPNEQINGSGSHITSLVYDKILSHISEEQSFMVNIVLISEQEKGFILPTRTPHKIFISEYFIKS